jgi:hypothetical protein
MFQGKLIRAHPFLPQTGLPALCSTAAEIVAGVCYPHYYESGNI